MRNLTIEECDLINGGIHINIGAFIATIAIGALGGPAGLGIALSGIVIAEGVQNLAELGDEHFRSDQ
jgi:hypothetical protein